MGLWRCTEEVCEFDPLEWGNGHVGGRLGVHLKTLYGEEKRKKNMDGAWRGREQSHDWG